jgi:hypothetical protein
MHSPLSEKTSLKASTATTLLEHSKTVPEVESSERISQTIEITSPVKLAIDFTSESGWASEFPSAKHATSFPGPRGGSFLWMSLEEEMGIPSVSTSQPAYLHRLELSLGAEPVALYSCRKISLKSSSPALNWFKKLIAAPSSTAIHPQATMQQLRRQKAFGMCLIPDLPTGPLAVGRDPQPVIWMSNQQGQTTVIPFDSKHLQCKDRVDWLEGRSSHFDQVTSKPIYDYCTGKPVVLGRTTLTNGKYSRFVAVLLSAGRPKIAAFMAPRNLNLNCFGADDLWMVAFAAEKDRLMIYMIARQRNCLAAVYQTANLNITQVIRLESGMQSNSVKIVVLLQDGSVKRLLLSNLSKELARFEGSAGLLPTFPVAEFESVCDGPFEEVRWCGDGFLARSQHSIFRLSSKFELESSYSQPRSQVTDSLLLQMDNGVVCVTLERDLLTEGVQLVIIDIADMKSIATIRLPHQIKSSSSLFYLFNRSFE